MSIPIGTEINTVYTVNILCKFLKDSIRHVQFAAGIRARAHLDSAVNVFCQRLPPAEEVMYLAVEEVRN